MARQLMYLKNVVTLALDAAMCKGCGTCVEACPRGVLERSNGAVAIVDRDSCIECGACSRNCPFGAITVAAGVGCATAIIRGALRGTAPDCCCSDSSDCC
jgi:NAD-dependent dihydropyrimidine dehydrogenase PreA subunit